MSTDAPLDRKLIIDELWRYISNVTIVYDGVPELPRLPLSKKEFYEYYYSITCDKLLIWHDVCRPNTETPPWARAGYFDGGKSSEELADDIQKAAIPYRMTSPLRGDRTTQGGTTEAQKIYESGITNSAALMAYIESSDKPAVSARDIRRDRQNRIAVAFFKLEDQYPDAYEAWSMMYETQGFTRRLSTDKALMAKLEIDRTTVFRRLKRARTFLDRELRQDWQVFDDGE